MCYWIAFKLHETILHHNCYSITNIISENCNFFNSEFTHFSTGLDVKFFTIFNFNPFKVLLMWKCITGLFSNFITFFNTFAALSQFSVKITYNSQLIHFLVGVDLNFNGVLGGTTCFTSFALPLVFSMHLVKHVVAPCRARIGTL